MHAPFTHLTEKSLAVQINNYTLLLGNGSGHDRGAGK